ncbi:MAG: hypothetical protein RMJ51_01810 [Candidatus Calescibacterium sp.]|nr:coenzyme F420-0:L-glutamate ligase [Candidatus Calescibacterium sp.]MCX7971937.1 coenzyme F420-0:L-glutamate ligase [bacterium]MDW8194964.1 hypothetical protein [Candidatus Calescibacterium sp.]
MLLYIITVSLFILFLPTFIALVLYFVRKGCSLDLKIESYYSKIIDDKLFLSFEVGVINRGIFHSIILNCEADLLPIIPSRKTVYNNSFYYFDTVILKKNKTHKFWIEFELSNKDFQDYKDRFGLALRVWYYDLKPIRTLYKEFSIENIDLNLDFQPGKTGGAKLWSGVDILQIGNVFCLKVPVITHFQGSDYLVSLIERGLELINIRNINCKKLLICIAESLVAIIQGRVRSVYDVYPSFAAKLFNHYFGEDSSLSSPYALELVIRDIGFWRFYFSLFPGILGKIMGFSGWFYIFAGRKAAAVDDAGGTIRPFDKFVVLAPDKPDEFSITLKQRLQKNNNIDIEVFVVDANDLGKVDILGYSDKQYREIVIEALKTNPQGNDDQQTPIVFIPVY